MNKCILRGNVGQDPTITNFDNGGKVAQFTLATTERGYKTKDGREIPDVTDWHNIVVRQTGLAGVVEQYVKSANRPRPRLPNTPRAIIPRRLRICPFSLFFCKGP